MMYLELTGDGDRHFIPAGTSPTGARLEAPCVFRASKGWYARRKACPWVRPIGRGAYEGRVAGEGVDEAPTTVRQKARVARDKTAERRRTIARELPDERPGPQGDALTRILWALIKGTYNQRRSVLADVSELSATGSDEVIKRRLYAELYDREMSGGD